MKATDQLTKLKNRVRKAINPYFQRVSSKDLNALEIDLGLAHTIAGVERIYREWQQKLAFKNIATLPDLNQKPGQKAAA